MSISSSEIISVSHLHLSEHLSRQDHISRDITQALNPALAFNKSLGQRSFTHTYTRRDMQPYYKCQNLSFTVQREEFLTYLLYHVESLFFVFTCLKVVDETSGMTHAIQLFHYPPISFPDKGSDIKLSMEDN